MTELNEIDSIISNYINIDALRSFQLNALQIMIKKYFNCINNIDDENVTFVYGYPGSGKTFASLIAAKIFIDRGWCEKVIIVVPSGNLLDQWRDEAEKDIIGLDLTKNSSYKERQLDFATSKKIRDRFDGHLITYQRLVKKESYEGLLSEFSKFSYMCIFDEAHQ